LTQTGPSAYQRPRALVTIVSPSQQNMVSNPDFSLGNTGWSAITSGTPSVVSAISIVAQPSGL
jgi:hypothetical protein